MALNKRKLRKALFYMSNYLRENRKKSNGRKVWVKNLFRKKKLSKMCATKITEYTCSR